MSEEIIKTSRRKRAVKAPVTPTPPPKVTCGKCGYRGPVIDGIIPAKHPR